MVRQLKPKVWLRKGSEYNPLHERANRYGMVELWYAYNDRGDAVTWAPTRAEAERGARERGYTIGGTLK